MRGEKGVGGQRDSGEGSGTGREGTASALAALLRAAAITVFGNRLSTLPHSSLSGGGNKHVSGEQTLGESDGKDGRNFAQRHTQKTGSSQRNRDKGNSKGKIFEEKSCEGFSLFFFYRKPPHITERRFDVFSPGNRERSCAIPPGGVASPLYDAPRAALLTVPNASMEQIKC